MHLKGFFRYENRPFAFSLNIPNGYDIRPATILITSDESQDYYRAAVSIFPYGGREILIPCNKPAHGQVAKGSPAPDLSTRAEYAVEVVKTLIANRVSQGEKPYNQEPEIDFNSAI